MKSLVLPIVLTFFLVGCATTRTITLSAKPADATLRIEGVDRGRGPITERFTFRDPTDTKRIVASRLGYRDQVLIITRDEVRRNITIDLAKQTRRVNITVNPASALLKIDGRPVREEALSNWSVELDFTVDAQNNWNSYTVTAERPGFQTASAKINWTDRENVYNLVMEPMRKDLSIETSPPGAQVFINNELVGTSPVRVTQRAFNVDLDTNEWIPQTVKAVKPGYDPVEVPISWDDGRSNYSVDIPPRRKQVRITTVPAGAQVQIDGANVTRTQAGDTLASLTFVPVNEEGVLRKFTGRATKTDDPESIWQPLDFELAWDNGRTEYSLALTEILTRPVDLLTISVERPSDTWIIAPKVVPTMGFKHEKESGGRETPRAITKLPKGSQIGSIAISPDGTTLLYTLLTGSTAADFRSQVRSVRTDGTGGESSLSDGRSLDLFPVFTPGGDQIVFSSNRFGRRLSIVAMNASGAPGVTSLTSGDNNDLWPTIDSDPRPRLFYQSMVDTRAEPRLFSSPMDTPARRTDITATPSGALQPRIGPTNDWVIFSAVNEKTGKRDVFRVPAQGGQPQNLTNSPDTDDFDPVWSKDGNRIAFVSDRALDADGRANYDIWVLDLSRPGSPVQITDNPAHDDMPVWDPAGGGIYFRSNRKGEWQVWRIPVK